ncbi:MAG: 2Fe-2S iron-sulfur cluster-binding protein, partial [Gammaproteobacteria bacterium]
MAHRLPIQPHHWIERDRVLRFSFEGESITGYPGDTLTSAILASGRRVLGRSFKYHRPRGVLSAANHDANVLLQTRTRLNIRGDVEPVIDGEAYTAVNTAGGLARDRRRILDRLSAVLPVGFYYKAFFRPHWLFPWWEKLIRSLSGLGVVSTDFPRERFARRRVACDCLVIGAGAAGIAAAAALVDSGLRVIVVDENARIGGRLSYSRRDAEESAAWFENAVAGLADAPNVEIWTDACALGYYSDREVPILRAHGID